MQSVNIGAIIGGIAGGLAGLIILSECLCVQSALDAS
jgi:hypothetical protein